VEGFVENVRTRNKEQITTGIGGDHNHPSTNPDTGLCGWKSQKERPFVNQEGGERGYISVNKQTRKPLQNNHGPKAKALVLKEKRTRPGKKIFSWKGPLGLTGEVKDANPKHGPTSRGAELQWEGPLPWGKP